jgi:outer membrane protein assembly factor BamA
MNSHRLIGAVLTVVCGVAWPAPAAAWLVVDHVAIRGTPGVTTRVLATRMHLYPGDPVDFAVLKAAEQRLIESDLFRSVRVFIELPTEEAVRRMYLDDKTYPVEVVVEAVGKLTWFAFPTASFGSGDWAGGLAYANQNVLGRDVHLLAAGQMGQSRSYAFIEYSDPLVAGAPLTYSLTGLYRQEQIRFFVNHTMFMQVPTSVIGGSGWIGWVLSPHTRASLGLSARRLRVSAVQDLAPGAIALPYNPRSGRVFLLQFQIQYDDTSAREGLRHGVRVRIKNELSDRYWGSDFDYSKFETLVELYGRYRWNYPSVIFCGIIDYPTSDRGRPVTELLRIGGPNLRGYLTNEFNGDTLGSMQAEDQAVLLHLRIPWTRVPFNVAAAIFVDAATLLQRYPGGTSVPPPDVAPPPVRSKLKDIHASAGGGVRIILPGVAIPAFKVDVGYGIDVHAVGVTISIAGGGM